MTSTNNNIEHFDILGAISNLGNPSTMIAFGQSLGIIPTGVTTIPDNSLLITLAMQKLLIPYVKVPGHMGGTYTFDSQNLKCVGTVTSLVEGRPVATQNMSYIAVKNLPSYNILSKNDPDEILIVTDDGQYIFPFYEGPSSELSTYTSNLIFSTVLALILTTQKDKNSAIPLYSDLKVLFWASVSQCNYTPNNTVYATAMGKYASRSGEKIPNNLMPLARMVVLAGDPTLDRSGILYTGNMSSYTPPKDDNGQYKPPYKIYQFDDPIPYTDYAGGNYKIPLSAYTSKSDLLARYTFLSLFLDNLYKILIEKTDTAMSNITFAADYTNVPLQFQEYDSRNPKFIIAPSVPRPLPVTVLTTVESPRYTGGPRIRFTPLPNDTYRQPPIPATYTPPDVNLQNGPLPLIIMTGYINNYIIDSNGMCNGTLNSKTSTTVSYIPITNDPRYKINVLNNPDQIIMTTDDGKYILPFGDGTISTYNKRYHDAFVSYIIASSNQTMTIPLYNDLRILYYAANSQLNNFTSEISNNQTYSRYSSNLSMLPLIKMLILSNNPSLDRSTILRTGDLSIQNYEEDLSTGLLKPPTTDQMGQPIPSSLSAERTAVFSNLFYFLHVFRSVNTGEMPDVSNICLPFTASTINILPTTLQKYDCRNSNFGIKSGDALPDEAPQENAPQEEAEVDYSAYYPLIIGGVVCFIITICIIGGIVIFFMMKSKKSKVKSDGGFYLYDIN
jgi:hypothetical protein